MHNLLQCFTVFVEWLRSNFQIHHFTNTFKVVVPGGLVVTCENYFVLYKSGFSWLKDYENIDGLAIVQVELKWVDGERTRF